ncbi:MAG: amidohydrolase, partial [Lentisphaeria bacterium]|nr:amidohydrolase [Lentisphaeria bacterium]
MNGFDFLPEIIDLRKCFHRIPEIAGKEFKTCALIRETLSRIPGVEILEPFLGTDTVAVVRGGKGPGVNVLLRADIDALPGTENTGCEFASIHPGMMHACGHDVHISVLIGAVRAIAECRNDFSGTVRFVFQPGEENKAMARDLIAAGALGDPLPDVCAALHVMPGKAAGEISVRPGAMMASCNVFNVIVHGQGGHGSLPCASRSPLVAAAAMIMELQNIVANRIDPRKAAVVSVCRFESGHTDNVIPDTAEFTGTLRSLDNETAGVLEDSLHEICNALAVVYRVKCDVQSNQSYLATCNDPEVVERFCAVVKKLGIPLHILPESAMSSEDFSFYLDRIPGVFFHLGAGVDAPSLHNSAFLPPDAVIENGIRVISAFALECLKDR